MSPPTQGQLLTQLVLGREKEVSCWGSYTRQTKQVIEQISALDYLESMANIQSKDYLFISANIERIAMWPLSIFRRFNRMDRYLMVLDCDGTDEMLAACHTLKHDKLNYALIQSTPSHYWIVTDYIDSFTNVFKLAKTIPGVDPKYLDFCDKNSMFTIRGMPKNGHIPQFQDSKSLKTEKAAWWFEAAYELYQHPATQRRTMTDKLQHHIADKSMAVLASDPTFEL